jgi:DNA-binding transcriptional LysR family regulator
MADQGNSYANLARNAADLCAFLIVCEQGQLSAAAREMKITQPSLSQRIRNLEQSLGKTLFERTPKGVVLTRDGHALQRQLHDPLTELATRFQSFSDGPKQERLLISADFAFAYFWLLPRMPEIRQKLGQVDICILTSQEPKVDRVPETDLLIYMGSASQAGPEETMLMREKVGVVCSPDFKAAHPEIRTPADLMQTPQLLHLNTPSRTKFWCSWSEWFSHWQLDPSKLGKGLILSSYEIIVRAATDSQGVALGWRGLIDETVEKGELAFLMPETCETDRGYYIVAGERGTSPAVQDLHDWIVQETGIWRE